MGNPTREGINWEIAGIAVLKGRKRCQVGLLPLLGKSDLLVYII
jgi:hypothetical protein